MKCLLKIKFRDDKVETFECFDIPYVGDKWITIYLIDRSRKIIPSEAIAEINYSFVPA